jgi:photosystem II stability/assembly factor-like uncharacterized protein
MNKRLLFTATLATFLGASVAQAQTWTAVDLGANNPSLGVTDMDMPSADVIWGVQYDGSGATPAVVVQECFLSTDGGATWLTSTIATANSADKTLTNVSAIDGSTAYVGGFDATNGGGWLFKTADGANTFTEVTTIPTMQYLNIVHFFDANTGILLGDPTGTGTFWEIFRTTDAGATWTRVPQANIPAANRSDFGLTNQYSTFGDNIWFTSSQGSIYHSTDRGLTWMKHATGFRAAGTTSAIREVEFSSATDGLVVSSAGLIRRTTDGGMTWTAVTTTGTVFKDNLAAIPGLSNTYVGVSANPTTGVGTSLTRDGGLTWTTLDSAITQYTEVIYFDATHGWAGGFTQAGGTGGAFRFTGSLLLNTKNDIVREAAAAYPNPTTGVLRFAGADPRETVTVYDQSGRFVLRQAVGTSASLDLSNQPTGLYQLVFTGGKVARTTRIAVTR